MRLRRRRRQPPCWVSPVPPCVPSSCRTTQGRAHAAGEPSHQPRRSLTGCQEAPLASRGRGDAGGCCHAGYRLYRLAPRHITVLHEPALNGRVRAQQRHNVAEGAHPAIGDWREGVGKPKLRKASACRPNTDTKWSGERGTAEGSQDVTEGADHVTGGGKGKPRKVGDVTEGV